MTVVSTGLLDICVVAKHWKIRPDSSISCSYCGIHISLGSLDQIFILSLRKETIAIDTG